MEPSPHPHTHPFEHPYASFGVRLLAYLLDSLIIFIVTAIPLFFIRFFWLKEQDELTTNLVLNGVSVVLGWLYYATMESSKYQATFGKQLMGIFVTDEAGYPPTFLRATGRYFGKILSAITLLIGYLMALFTARRQALHDILAGTLVFRHTPAEEV